MTSTLPRIPPPLLPYLDLLHASSPSLTLVTSTLGASANWLILRYIYAILGPEAHKSAQHDGNDEESTQACSKVVLVSWMNDFGFWRSEARSALGLDLVKAQKEGHFAFVDGFSGLLDRFSPSSANSQSPVLSSTSQNLNNARTPFTAKPTHPGTDTIASITRLITAAASSLNADSSQSKCLIIYDTPNALLNVHAPLLTTRDLATCFLDWRSLSHSCVIAVPANIPLTPNSDANADMTPIEAEHASFIVAMAHQARIVLGTRKLRTGFAKDVSGVIRVTVGGDVDEESIELKGTSARDLDLVEGEWLYHVGWDGRVRVWSRGASDG